MTFDATNDRVLGLRRVGTETFTTPVRGRSKL